jgi:hypothetical protein
MTPQQFLAGLRWYLVWSFSRTGQSTAQVNTIIKKENDRIAKGGKLESSTYYKGVVAFLASPIYTGIYPTTSPTGATQTGAMSNDEFLRELYGYYRFEMDWGDTAPTDIDKYINSSIIAPEKARLATGGRVEDSPYWEQVSYRQHMYQESMKPEPDVNLSIETYAGSQFIVPRDAQGKIIPNSQYFTSLGKAEAEGLTAYQQQQVNIAQQQLDLDRQQAQWTRQQAMMPYGQMTAYERAQMGLQQQAYAAETAALPAESWIEQWFRSNPQALQTGITPPRYVPKDTRCPPGMSEEEYNTRLAQTETKAIAAIKSWEMGGQLPSSRDMPLPGNFVYIAPKMYPKGVPQPTGPSITTDIGVVGGSPWGETLGRHSEIAYQPVSWSQQQHNIHLANIKSQKADRKYTGPTTPPAPPWLNQFVLSQVTGRPITKAPITTPSGQQWLATPPTVQAGLQGYGSWAGYNLSDILAQMQRMQPQTPVGSNYPRYSPAYQYA